MALALGEGCGFYYPLSGLFPEEAEDHVRHRFFLSRFGQMEAFGQFAQCARSIASEVQDCDYVEDVDCGDGAPSREVVGVQRVGGVVGIYPVDAAKDLDVSAEAA